MTRLFLVCLLVLLLVGCAAGPNTAAKSPDVDGNVAGFWLGLWHGMIAPLTWLISLFTSSVSFYEIHNNGGWYNFGFVLGAGILAGSTSHSTK